MKAIKTGKSQVILRGRKGTRPGRQPLNQLGPWLCKGVWILFYSQWKANRLFFIARADSNFIKIALSDTHRMRPIH